MRVCGVPECGLIHHAHGYCATHAYRFKTHGDPLISLLDRENPERRFWSYVDKGGSCWLWTGTVCNGYGHVSWYGKTRKVHQVAWELLRGPMPAGLQPDHLCRTPVCVNPDHIEWVPQRVNAQRQIARCAKLTHCKRGHAFDETNTRISPDGKRICRACKRAAYHRSKASHG